MDPCLIIAVSGAGFNSPIVLLKVGDTLILCVKIKRPAGLSTGGPLCLGDRTYPLAWGMPKKLFQGRQIVKSRFWR